MQNTVTLIAATFLLALPLGLRAEETQPDRPPVNTSAENNADNSARNVRERSQSEKTPVTQNENKADLEMTRQIRRSVVEDKSLSTYAHNVKIITQDGMVDLKGPVRSQEEKKAVEAKAAAVAGEGKVKSQLEVAPKDSK